MLWIFQPKIEMIHEYFQKILYNISPNELFLFSFLVQNIEILKKMQNMNNPDTVIREGVN